MNATATTPMSDEKFRTTIEEHLEAYTHETILPLEEFEVDLRDPIEDETTYTEAELDDTDVTIARINTTFDDDQFGFEIVNTTAEDIGLENVIMRAVEHLEAVLYEEHLAEKFE